MGIFQTHSNKGRIASLLGGIGIGAALMYLLDPDRGVRRRALVRDKAVHLGRVTGERLGARSRDLRNRAKGIASRFKRDRPEEAPSDEPRETAGEVSALQGSKRPRSKADRAQARFESDNA